MNSICWDLVPIGGWVSPDADLQTLAEIEGVFAHREDVAYASYTFDTRQYEHMSKSASEAMHLYVDVHMSNGVQLGVNQVTIYKPIGSAFPPGAIDALSDVIRRIGLRIWSRDACVFISLEDALNSWRS